MSIIKILLHQTRKRYFHFPTFSLAGFEISIKKGKWKVVGNSGEMLNLSVFFSQCIHRSSSMRIVMPTLDRTTLLQPVTLASTTIEHRRIFQDQTALPVIGIAKTSSSVERVESLLVRQTL